MPDGLSGGASEPPRLLLQPSVISRRNAAPDDHLLRNAEHAVMLGYPEVVPNKGEFSEPIILVGGGPSIRTTLPMLRQLYEQGMKVVATGSVHDFLIDHGIIPWAAVALDPQPAMAGFYRKPQKAIHYLIAAICHPLVFKRLKRMNVALWFPDVGLDFSKYLPKMLVGGGCVVTMRSLNLMYGIGFRNFHFFGFDGCDGEDGEHHAYKTIPDGEAKEYWLDGKRYVIRGAQLAQFFDFDKMLVAHGDKFNLTIHGNGLMAALHRHRTLQGLPTLEEVHGIPALQN